MKKPLQAISLSAALLFGMMPVAVFANQSETPQTGTVTVTDTTAGTYQVYQLFTGNFSTTQKAGETVAVPNVTVPESLINGTANQAQPADTNMMGNIAFGASAGDNGADLIKAINDYVATLDTKPDGWTTFAPTDENGSSAAYKTAKLIADTPALQTTAFSNFLANAGLKPFGDSLTPADGRVTTPELPSGYYLIASTPAAGQTQTATSGIMLPVAGELTIHNKATTPTLVKEVKNSGKAEGDSETAYGNSASVQISGTDTKTADQQTLANLQLDTAVYQLTGTVAQNIADYETYTYTFTDIMPAGVTTDATNFATWNPMITFIGKDSKGADVTKQVALADSGFTVAFDNSTTAPTTTTVTLTAADLLKVLGDQGIDYSYANAPAIKVLVEYTPKYNEDSLKAIYSQQSTLDKPQVNTANVTFSNNPNASAAGQGTTGKTPDTETKVYSYNLTINKQQPDGSAAKPLTGAKFALFAGDKMVGNEITADENGVFTFTGLQDGTEYTIKETQTPSGFKNIDPIKFTIQATKDATTGNVTSIAVTETSDPSNAATATISTDNTATVNMNVLNVAGPSMPLTGENQMLIGLGAGALIIGISAYFYTRKKQETE